MVGSPAITRVCVVDAEDAARRPIEPILTVDQAAECLRERITIEGARLSYRPNCESMHRVHVSLALAGSNSTDKARDPTVA
jgi:hypothetical protein